MTAPKYEVVTHENEFHNHAAFQILEGEYEGVVFQYDTVKVEGDVDTDDEDIYLSFNTITISKPDDLELTEEKTEVIMGAILQDIITKHAEAVIDEHGTDDTQEPTDEREIPS